MIAATGMEWRRLEADGVEELLGRGVYYGAGCSEAAQCDDDEVIVVGASSSAVPARAMFICIGGAPRRVGGAVGDGAMAVALAHRVREKLPHPGDAVDKL